MSRRPLLALLLISPLLLAGCLGTTNAEWGSGDGEYEVVWSGDVSDDITVHSALADSTSRHIDSSLKAIGCGPNGGVPQGQNNISLQNWTYSEPLDLSGWMSASKVFHSGTTVSSPPENTALASIVVKTKPYEDAQTESAESIGRLMLKKWDGPTMVEIKMPGTPSFESQPEWPWAVVGLVPANEHIKDGFIGLDWHQAVKVEGYLLWDPNPDKSTSQIYPSGVETNDCRIVAGRDGMGFKGHILVTKVVLGGTGEVISSSGDDDSEWVLGNVPLVGRGGYLTLLLFVGVGGGTGLFIFSQIGIRAQARAMASKGLTEAQLQSASDAKSAVKKARKEGRGPNAVGGTGESAAEQREREQRLAEGGKSKAENLKGFNLEDALIDDDIHPDSNRVVMGAGASISKAAVEVEEKEKGLREDDLLGELEDEPAFGYPNDMGERRQESPPSGGPPQMEPAVRRAKAPPFVEEDDEPLPRRTPPSRGPPLKGPPQSKESPKPKGVHDKENDEFSDFNF